jgi:iron complex outermembrane receptor protein
MNPMTRNAYLSGVGLALCWVQPGQAQTISASGGATATPQTDTESPDDTSKVDPNEIVVTALKRAESLQNTPATVSVLSGQAIANSGIASVEQLGQVLPGVIIQRPPNNTANATIRGVGTSPGPLSFEQGVGMFVDGVYAARGPDFLAALFDVDRIEVVKGTQAAVLGKNTSLGAITISTRRPGDKFEVDALASYEFNRDSKVISGGMDVPLSSTLAIRVAGQYQDLGGFMINRADNGVAEDRARLTKEAAGRVTAVWRPAADLTVTANYSHEFLRNYGNVAEFIVGSPTAAAAFAAAGASGLYETNQDFHYAVNGVDGGPTRLRQKSDRATMTLDYDLPFATLTSITGWTRFDQRRHIDYDYTPGSYFDDHAYIRGSQLSEELRLSSVGGSPFQYLIGGLYVRNKLYQNLYQSVHYPVNPQGAFDGTFDQLTETWSAFAQPSFVVTDKFKLVAGIRVTSEKKTVDMERIRLVAGSYTTVQYPPFPLTRLERSETNVDGSVSAQYRPTDGLMLYASWGQGTKGGGFSEFAVPATAPYAKEVARTIEAGFKFEGPGRDWHLNAAYFHTRVQDFQNNLFNGSNFVVQNVHVASDGAELDALWEPASKLRFTAEGTYARTRNLDALPGKSDRFPRSPRLSGKVAVNYAPDLSGRFALNLGADLTYRSAISHQLDPAAVPLGAAFPTVNGIIGIRDRTNGLDLSLIGRNINNARSLSFAFAAPNLPGAAIGTPEEPRTIMLQIKFTR